MGILNPLGVTVPGARSGTGMVLGRDWASNLSTYFHSSGSYIIRIMETTDPVNSNLGDTVLPPLRIGTAPGRILV